MWCGVGRQSLLATASADGPIKRFFQLIEEGWTVSVPSLLTPLTAPRIFSELAGARRKRRR